MRQIGGASNSRIESFNPALRIDYPADTNYGLQH